LRPECRPQRRQQPSLFELVNIRLRFYWV